jgi:hypothetical protein
MDIQKGDSFPFCESARSCVTPVLGLRDFALARDPAEQLTKYDAARRTAEQTFTSNEEALESLAVEEKNFWYTSSHHLDRRRAA